MSGALCGFEPVDVGGVKVREMRRWSGTHRDIAFAVEAHSKMLSHRSPIFCGYIYLPEQAFAPEQWAAWWDDAPEVREFSPGGTEYLRHKQDGPCLDGMSGGVTLYEQLNEKLIGQRTIKIGWDYNHLWDAEAPCAPELASVARDCVRAIDDLRSRYAVKHRCGHCGRWHVEPVAGPRCVACAS